MLPGPTFVKTFLRTYAEMLGLDPHVLVEEYRERRGARTSSSSSRSGRPRRWRGTAGGGPRLGPGMVALLVLVGVVAVLVVYRADERRQRKRLEASRPETTAERTTTQPKKKEKPPPPKRVVVRVVPASAYLHVRRPGRWDVRRLRGHGRHGRRPFAASAAVNLGRRDVPPVDERQASACQRRGPDPVGYAFSPLGIRASFRTESVPARSLVGRERARGHRRHRNRGPHRARPRPERALAVGQAARAGRGARAHHDLRRPPAGHRGAAPLPGRGRTWT